ncbi:hypothetical protein BB31_24100 [Amycolatopsis lurida NRRL 2430]|uniref:Uncharacterized protein n=1 Tax=Amycolatopsis lurida NRRL 2430 TaxID=1460371 RepID=A0A2P2FQ31_AMYLU|nr:hypothetical protein BB31_24100 [Amycolatopsis lurida NRRL 2430]
MIVTAIAFTTRNSIASGKPRLPPRVRNAQCRDSRYAKAVATTVAIASAVTGFSCRTVSFSP